MIELNFDNRVYKITPDFSTLCEIEAELGSLGELLERSIQGKLKVSEQVAIIHILLQSKGREVDYLQLGDFILQQGLNKYSLLITEFLQLILK